MKSKLILVVFLCAVFVTAMHLLSQPASAQGAPPPVTEQANQEWYLILYNTFGGAVISWIVAFLKKNEWVKNHAKWVALAVSILATLLPVVAGLPFAANGVGAFIVSVVTQLVAAVGTHEIVNKPIREAARE